MTMTRTKTRSFDSAAVPSTRTPRPPSWRPQGGQGLGHPQGDGDDEQPLERGDDGEDPAPAHRPDERTAEDGGDDRGDALDGHDQGQGPGGGDAAGAVGDDGAAQHHAGRPAQPLEEAGDEEKARPRSECGARSGDEGEDRAPQQKGTAPEAVGQDADAQLSQRHAHEEHGQGQLRRRSGDAEVRGHPAEGRQVGVHGQRGDGGERGQGDQEGGGEGGAQSAGLRGSGGGCGRFGNDPGGILLPLGGGGSGGGCGHDGRLRSGPARMSAPPGVRSSTPEPVVSPGGPGPNGIGIGPSGGRDRPRRPRSRRSMGGGADPGASRPAPPDPAELSAGCAFSAGFACRFRRFRRGGGARAGCHCALSAAVGGVRDARIAGYSPATAPMTTVTASPARTTSIGRAKSHPLTAVMP